jgi:predicted Zn-dependent peptidase
VITNVRRYLNCIVLQILVGLVFSAQTLAIELDGSVKAHTLANGLRVLLLERHQAPTVSFVIRFKVGSVNEQAGMSGMAHLLEHMLFKGTRTLGTTDYTREQEIHEKIDGVIEQLDAERLKGTQGDSSSIDRLETKLRELQQEQSQLTVKEEMSALYTRNGAVGLNASTGYDLTTYTVSLPANRQELWAAIEADRMLNPVFREFYLEREVVREERRQRNESNPGGKLMEAFLTSAFQAHPYGRPIVGWDSDLQQLKRERVT